MVNSEIKFPRNLKIKQGIREITFPRKLVTLKYLKDIGFEKLEKSIYTFQNSHVANSHFLKEVITWMKLVDRPSIVVQSFWKYNDS